MKNHQVLGQRQGMRPTGAQWCLPRRPGCPRSDVDVAMACYGLPHLSCHVRKTSTPMRMSWLARLLLTCSVFSRLCNYFAWGVEEPTGEIDCTYTYKKVGEISIDELEGAISHVGSVWEWYIHPYCHFDSESDDKLVSFIVPLNVQVPKPFEKLQDPKIKGAT